MKLFIEILLRAVLYILGFLFLWLTMARILRKFLHFPAPAFLGHFLDSDLRRRIQPPDQLIQRTGFKPGQRVLEIGCGSGAYTTFVARAVGPDGVVEALDIQPAMLVQLKKKLDLPENEDLKNINLHEGSAYELPFEDESIDLTYIITVLAEIPDQGRALAEVYRVLRPGGILAVSEFLPDPDYPLSKTTAKRGRKAGFEVEGIYGNLWTYTVRFRKRIPTDNLVSDHL
jgi:ubiquinone/menaquinone biosynthesis C-methylase UbiE